MEYGNFSEKDILSILTSFFEKTYAFLSILDVTSGECVVIYDNTRPESECKKTITLGEIAELSEAFVHPLFHQRFIDEINEENLKRAYQDDQTLELEMLLLKKIDDKYHWYNLSLSPIKNESGHALFIYGIRTADGEVKEREENRNRQFNDIVLQQLIDNYILVYIVDLNSSMSRLVLSRYQDEFDVYANMFSDHRAMMEHLNNNYIDADFKKDFAKYYNYEYIKDQLDSGKKQLLFVFKDVSSRTFEINISKYPDYRSDYRLAIFSIRELGPK